MASERLTTENNPKLAKVYNEYMPEDLDDMIYAIHKIRRKKEKIMKQHLWPPSINGMAVKVFNYSS